MTVSVIQRTHSSALRTGFALSTAIASGLIIPAPAHAQYIASQYPAQRDVDENGVDIPSAEVPMQAVDLSIGSGKYALKLDRLVSAADASSVLFALDVSAVYDGPTGNVVVQFLGVSKKFTWVSGTTYTNDAGTGETWDSNGFTDAEGTLYKFEYTTGTYENNDVVAHVTQIVRPDGYTIDLSWDAAGYYTDTGDYSYWTYYPRIDWIRDNANHFIRLRYVGNDFYTPGTFQQITGATAINTTVQACNSANDYCSSVTSPWPTVAYSFTSGGMSVSGPSSRSQTYSWTTSTFAASGDGHSTSIYTYPYDPTEVQKTKFDLTQDGVVHTYRYTGTPGYPANAVTVDASGMDTKTYSLSGGHVTAMTQNSATASFAYDSQGRLTEITAPEGNKAQYTLDARGNITTTTLKAKSGSGLSDIVLQSNYASSCTNLKTCNLPTWSKDALGNQTDYSYSSTTGQLTSVQLPAPTSGSARPTTNYSYTTSSGVSVLSGTSTCVTGSSCAGTSAEAKMSYTYDSNLEIASKSRAAGDASLAAGEAYSHDSIGNLTSVDGPLSGSADTTTFRYDGLRRLVGTISPDPDGIGSLKQRATKYTYDSAFNLTNVEQGTVNGTSDSDWSAFSSLQSAGLTYNSNGQLTKEVISGGGTTYSVTQLSYDALGRVECRASRMNSATWSSLPSSACSLGTVGSFGPDRIVRRTFDGEGRPYQVYSAYGSGDQATESTSLYNANGTVASLTDAEGNKTSYSYDGFDRRVKVSFPSASKGAGTSSSTDYEQYTLDALVT